MLDVTFNPLLLSIKNNQLLNLNLSSLGDNTDTHQQENLQFIATWEGHTDYVTALAVLPDGSVVSGSYDYTLYGSQGQSSEQLTFFKSAVFDVVHDDGTRAWLQVDDTSGRRGWVPRNYVKAMDTDNAFMMTPPPPLPS